MVDTKPALRHHPLTPPQPKRGACQKGRNSGIMSYGSLSGPRADWEEARTIQ